MANIINIQSTDIIKNSRADINTNFTNLNTDKVEKVTGKGLSTEDYTTTEKNKLAGIENNATADQTATEIKTAYESNLDTNAFTDAEKTKLTGIEDGAEVNTVDSVNGRTGAVVGLAEENAVVDLTTAQTIAGNKTFSGILKKTETEHSIVATSGTIDLNYNNGTYQKVTITDSTTFTISNPNRNFFTLKITNGGAYAITWPTIKWAGGVTPELTESGTDIVSFYYDGTDYYGDYQVGFATA